MKAQNSSVREMSDSDMLALGRLDLSAYAAAVYPRFELPPHLALIADRLEAMERGDIRRQVITTAPRHGKSLLCVQLFGAWWLGKHPADNVIIATHGEDLAATFGRSIRTIMSEGMHAAIFPDSRLSSDLSAMHRFGTTQGGSLRCVGKGSGLVGHGGDLIIADDLTRDSEEAHSDVQRQSTWSWFNEVLMTRLQPHGRVLVTGTRWSESDLLGRLIEDHGDQWQLVRLPALSEGAEVDPLGRGENEPLWPERFDRDALESMRRQLGSVPFAALYQAAPQPPEGRLFKREWFGTFAEPLPRGEYIRIALSLDCASKIGSSNDYSAAVLIGERADGFDVLFGWRDRVEYGDLRRAVLALAHDWRPDDILIEDASAGIAMGQQLEEETSLPVIMVRPTTSKMNRAMSTLGLFESGRVRVPEQATWKDDFLDDLCAFPAGKHDDFTDALVQGLRHFVDVPIPGIFVF